MLKINVFRIGNLKKGKGFVIFKIWYDELNMIFKTLFYLFLPVHNKKKILSFFFYLFNLLKNREIKKKI